MESRGPSFATGPTAHWDLQEQGFKHARFHQSTFSSSQGSQLPPPFLEGAGSSSHEGHKTRKHGSSTSPGAGTVDSGREEGSCCQHLSQKCCGGSPCTSGGWDLWKVGLPAGHRPGEVFKSHVLFPCLTPAVSVFWCGQTLPQTCTVMEAAPPRLPCQDGLKSPEPENQNKTFLL